MSCSRVSHPRGTKTAMLGHASLVGPSNSLSERTSHVRESNRLDRDTHGWARGVLIDCTSAVQLSLMVGQHTRGVIERDPSLRRAYRPIIDGR